MNILFLIGGKSIRESDHYPIFLTEIDGKTILERQINSCKELDAKKFLFCFRAEDLANFNLDFAVKQLVSNNTVISVKNETKGALCTAMLAAKYIDNDEELIILSIDDFMDENCKDVVDFFRKNNADAGVVSFCSIHPRYSYIKTLDGITVVEAAEKKPISKNALVSFYYYKHGHDFMECAKSVIRKDIPVNGNFYISETLNEMILKQKTVVVKTIKNSSFHSIKNEQLLAQYISEIKNLEASK